HSSLFCVRLRRLPRSPLFPYTTLFRSQVAGAALEAPQQRKGERSPERGNPRPAPAPAPGALPFGRQAQAGGRALGRALEEPRAGDRKSTRLNSSHLVISYAVFCLKKKN